MEIRAVNYGPSFFVLFFFYIDLWLACATLSVSVDKRKEPGSSEILNKNALSSVESRLLGARAWK